MTNYTDIISELKKCDQRACWRWPRKADKTGRGRVWIDGKITLAHRAVWQAMIGPIPDGKLLCHNCDNSGCVNPNHMYVGTHADNMRDMAERGRSHFARKPELAKERGRILGTSNIWSRGEHNGRAKLTSEQAATIRVSLMSERALARQYGVSSRTIHRIKHGEIWKP